jgi:hypothetical protein
VPKSDAERFRSEAEECHQKAARAYATRKLGCCWQPIASDWLKRPKRPNNYLGIEGRHVARRLVLDRGGHLDGRSPELPVFCCVGRLRSQSAKRCLRTA